MISDNELKSIKDYTLRSKMETEDWFKYGEGDRCVPFEEWCYGDKIVRLEQTFYNDIGCCGCYNPDDVREAILGVLKACRGNNLKDYVVFRNVIEDNPYAQFMVYILNNKKYLEHGSSITGCFLTKKGERYMRVLEEYLNLDDYDGTFSFMV